MMMTASRRAISFLCLCLLFVGSTMSLSPDLPISPRIPASVLTADDRARNSVTSFFVQSQNLCVRNRARSSVCRLQRLQQTGKIVLGRQISGVPALRSSADSNKQDGEQKDSAQSNTDAADQRQLLASLQNRKKEVEMGAGRIYVVCTQLGFLNVHTEPGDPNRLDNVVHQIVDGDIVESVGPDSGDWVQHDLGGWSIRKYGGFTWLKLYDTE